MAPIDPIEAANSMSLEEFSREYLPQFDSSDKPPSTKWTNPKSYLEYSISIQTASELSKKDLDSCFELIKLTSIEDYQKSSSGWNPGAKRKEMKLLDLKYLLVKSEDQVKGFASMMPTYEDDFPVLYCYEIHLDPELQGTGLGSHLMNHLYTIATNIPTICKIMLTCYTRNSTAMRFYSKLGFEIDEFSPGPKVLRNGTKVECAYVILSKPV